MRGTAARVGCLVAVLAALGCLSPIRKIDGAYRDSRHGYTIAAPTPGGGVWKRVSVEDASLAFTGPGPSSLSLQSRCGRPVADVQLMARHLVIGLREHRLIAAGPVEVAGRSGWSQTFEFDEEGQTVRLRTVTLVAGDCVFDWILAARGAFGASEADFDAWWQSFELDARFDAEEEQG